MASVAESCANFKEKLKGQVYLDTLVWNWDRLAKTGPHGKRYVEHFRPQFLNCFPAPANIPK